MRNFSAYFYHLSFELDIGWFGPGRLRKDNSDPEWEVFSGVLAQGLPFMAIHFLGGQYLKKYRSDLVRFLNYTGQILSDNLSECQNQI